MTTGSYLVAASADGDDTANQAFGRQRYLPHVSCVL